ncbi:hypothetical protein A33Y_0153 [Candidatus Carsonella ruddii CS isolate Thao2000]|uniref:Uncharacterized protein n=1 Tax=Candidatus Carsonella ruddii CS isolate Thao2000 TaxID=1202537 RepID=J7GWG8_CARRU|nr:hypothetical protein [Candidatus Carsonella ruddii]AFP83791.1 hypothetical protein A33Y_0153 [Candidatus Carsonella ruddii CS isolate Thao2000]
MNYNDYLLFINYYLFNNKKFFNKIIYNKIIFLKKYNNDFINMYYKTLKITLLKFNPFYGVKLESFINKNNFKKKQIFFLKKYIIPYKDLTYIFNLSIEKIRIKIKKNV